MQAQKSVRNMIEILEIRKIINISASNHFNEFYKL